MQYVLVVRELQHIPPYIDEGLKPQSHGSTRQPGMLARLLRARPALGRLPAPRGPTILLGPVGPVLPGTCAASTKAAPLPRHKDTPPPPKLLEQSPATWLRIYMELSKSRLSGLVVVTTGAGYFMGAAPLEPAVAVATLGGTFLCAASANSFNQIIEIPRDSAMNRTARRPLPSGRISTAHAMGWASTAGVVGVGTLLAGTNLLTAGLGLSTLGMYALIYTPMKPCSPWNTWIGAVVGAIPPVMGWTAAGGSLYSIEAAALGGALFLWQIPHFLALAWMYR